MLKTVATALLSAIAMTSCRSTVPEDLRLTGRTTSRCSEIYLASMLDLLNRPHDFEDRCVQVQGFYEYGALFITREHAMIGAFDLSIGIYEDNADRGSIQLACPSEYVTTVGRYSRLPSAGSSLGEWALTQIEEVSWYDQSDPESFPRRRACWPPGSS